MLFYPLFGILIAGVVMAICRPWIKALDLLINSTIASLDGLPGILLGAVLGGMMSADMGGPLNKTAYAFGVAEVTAFSAAAGQYRSWLLLWQAVWYHRWELPYARHCSLHILQKKNGKKENPTI